MEDLKIINADNLLYTSLGETELFDYVNWYNNIRIHSSLDYLTPIEYKKVSL